MQQRPVPKPMDTQEDGPSPQSDEVKHADSSPFYSEDTDAFFASQMKWLPKIKTYLLQHNRHLLEKNLKKFIEDLTVCFDPKDRERAKPLITECFSSCDALATQLNNLKQNLTRDKIDLAWKVSNLKTTGNLMDIYACTLDFFNKRCAFQFRRIKPALYVERDLIATAIKKVAAHDKKTQDLLDIHNHYFNDLLPPMLLAACKPFHDIRYELEYFAEKELAEALRTKFLAVVTHYFDNTLPILFQCMRALSVRGHCNGISVAIMSLDEKQREWFLKTISQLAACPDDHLPKMQQEIEKIHAIILPGQYPFEYFSSKDQLVRQTDLEKMLGEEKVGQAHKTKLDKPNIENLFACFMQSNGDKMILQSHHPRWKHAIAIYKTDKPAQAELFDSESRTAAAVTVTSANFFKAVAKCFTPPKTSKMLSQFTISYCVTRKS